MRQKKAKAIRDVTIIARYFIKKPHGKYQVGDVVLLVRNDKNIQYLVTIKPDGENACSCRADRKCYHLTYCEMIESAREAAAEKIIDAIYTMVLEVKKKPVKEVVPSRDLAPLNGNRPYSLLKIAS
jgi:hypothetical protein